MRAVSMRHTVVPSAERGAFREQARRTHAHYTKSGCHYWLFEESDLPGAYVEFYEATDAETLAAAHNGTAVVPPRMYVEVDLT